ncbi:helix-turn-helix domain-containing protein [Vitiosangium sp. GDMCC 1.1324]|uniref:AraC family transcriptional regulator n=1 Tax=Vitiosangium sp. (strain GDMCC 1.1324) TaxID=2138576 RepID=UPI000D3810DC|nr:helix-turn-helix transcriptional regulator [Vitiosangium sp. GDMCC 1.1324]PTL82137.1 AraC family transcriptional regulator [Vitiosangium sp. GDMCC 1.1324]
MYLPELPLHLVDVDPDEVARPVLVVGMKRMSGEHELNFHTHRKAQLFFMHRGEMTCEASNALWLVPPQSALWIPGSTRHRIKGRAPLEGFSMFVEPDAVVTLPRECCAVSVSPLLRELLFRAAALPALYPLDGKEARLVTVLLDELAAAQVEDLRLPMPTDTRLRRLVELLTAHPADGATMKKWAKRIGVGERTLNRLLVQETGMSFGRWRQRLHIILALQWLTRGASVQSVAIDLGYESASSFVTMFQKALGTSPARYIARRLDLASSDAGD